MADYNLTKSWSSIDTITDNADAGNIGKIGTQITVDADTIVNSGFYSLSGASPNLPAVLSGTLVVTGGIGNTFTTQLFTALTSQRSWFRSQNSGTWQPWREIYHDNGNGVTAADAATAIKGAKDGNIGVISPIEPDTQGININGMFRVNSGSPNTPITASFNVLNMASSTATNTNILLPWLSGVPRAFIQSQNGTYSSIEELYHTGNTGVLDFSAVAPLSNTVTISDNIGKILINRSGTAGSQIDFYNDNGVVGSISTSGVSTQYNTSSDNRLKNPIGKPTDADIDAKFNDIYDTFTLFNWKNNPDGDAVWGFLAHDVIDKGLDFGSEGEGPRNLNIGDVYETIPAETEQRPVMETITDEDGNEIEQQATDEQGNLLFEEVVVKEAVEKRVTPAGVDQSKITAYLVPFAELQRRRIDELESQLAALTQRLDAAGL